MDAYLDANATTRPAPEVVEAMLPYFGARFGNAASPHPRGRAASRAVEEAAERVADLLGVGAGRLVWTSGATESLNTAIQAAVARGLTIGREELVVSRSEHKAAIDTVESLETQGRVVVRWAGLDASGAVDLEVVRALVNERTAAVVAMSANNESGVMNDVTSVGEIARSQGASFVCDATQHIGKVPFNNEHVGADFLAVSAHKLHGPQGVGALAVPPSTSAEPLVHGGGHQRGWRSGTLNLPGIVGFGEAARLAGQRDEAATRRVRHLRGLLENELSSRCAPVTVNGQRASRLPNTTNLRVHGVDAEALLANCPQVEMATGSACASSVPAPSHVLLAMGLDREAADESFRLSVSYDTSEEEVKTAIEVIDHATAWLREVL